MGWASGSYVAIELIESFKRHIKDKDLRKKLYKDMILALEGNDWDTQDQATGYDTVYDELLAILYPRENYDKEIK
jgi:hypothetical protein